MPNPPAPSPPDSTHYYFRTFTFEDAVDYHWGPESIQAVLAWVEEHEKTSGDEYVEGLGGRVGDPSAVRVLFRRKPLQSVGLPTINIFHQEDAPKLVKAIEDAVTACFKREVDGPAVTQNTRRVEPKAVQAVLELLGMSVLDWTWPELLERIKQLKKLEAVPFDAAFDSLTPWAEVGARRAWLCRPRDHIAGGRAHRGIEEESARSSGRTG